MITVLFLRERLAQGMHDADLHKTPEPFCSFNSVLSNDFLAWDGPRPSTVKRMFPAFVYC
jgi:hypothetical protein